MVPYAGVFKLLYATEIWVALLVAGIIGVVIPFLLADRKLGLFYNYSYSGVIGDFGFIVVIAIGMSVIQRGEPLPEWLLSYWFQLGWLVVCIAVGIKLGKENFFLPTATWPDMYHNIVLVPIFMYFVMATGIPVVFVNGRTHEAVACVALVLVWLGLVLYDITDERIDQPARLQREFHIELRDGKFVKYPF